MTSIATIIVNYNTQDHLRSCLETVLDASAAEVIVVDSASNDGSADMVRVDFPSVTLVELKHNVGYGGAANIGVEHSVADYVLLPNSDTRIQPESLDALRDFLDQHPDAGVVGPRLENPDGTLQVSIYPFPTPLHVLLQESGAGRMGRLTRLSRGAFPQTWPHDCVCSVPWTLGAALATRRSAFESVGGFDDSFFMYYEEVDLCLRMREMGWEIYFAPVTTVMHVGGASTSKRRAEMHAQWFASIQHFYRRHYSRRKRVQLRVILGSVMLGRLLRDAVRLRLASTSGERDRLAENVAGWRRILLS